MIRASRIAAYNPTEPTPEIIVEALCNYFGKEVVDRLRYFFREEEELGFRKYSLEIKSTNDHNFFFFFQTEDSEGALERFRDNLVIELPEKALDERPVTRVDDLDRLIINGAILIQSDGHNNTRPSNRQDGGAFDRFDFGF